jgi:putative heme iron utilization protein
MGKVGTAPTQYCFDIGSFSTVGLHDLSLSFAMQAVTTAPGGAFTTLDLAYGTNGTTWTNFDTIAINQDGSFHIINDNLPTGANGHSTFFLQFCFTGATNASGHVFIDNIQVNSVIPEPTTYLGGLLGLLGVLVLCWYQRQCLVRGLSFRRA